MFWILFFFWTPKSLELYEEFSYANDLFFFYQVPIRNIFELNPGMNTIIDYRNNSEEIEFKIVPTMYSGACFVIQPKSVEGDS